MTKLENIAAWKQKIEIDYFTQFIRTWIPFNAWYKLNYPDDEQDRVIINKIKNDTANKFIAKIIYYVKNSGGTDNKDFSYYLDRLYFELESNSIFNRDEKISFEKIVIESNPQKNACNKYMKWEYKVDRCFDKTNPEKIAVKVKDSKGDYKVNKTFENYDLNKLLADKEFLALSDNQRNILKTCFETVEPYKHECLLLHTNPEYDRFKNPLNFIKIQDRMFINDEVKIAKAIIEIIYKLRNALFHGEVVPNGPNNKVYEAAYHLLRLLVKEL